MRWKRRDGVMNAGARRVQRVYLVLLLLHTLAASFIWGINTLFLLDAGLTNTQAFAANAFFTAGLVLFEVPTGVVPTEKSIWHPERELNGVDRYCCAAAFARVSS
jgi:hypothetical protein